MNYLRAVLNSDQKNEKIHLQDLVKIGKKLNKNTTTYEKELEKLASNNQPIQKIDKVQKIDKIKKIEPLKKEPEYKNSTYNIDNVFVKDNQIIIDFKHYLKKDYIKFIEEKRGNKYLDIFDFNGRFKDASPTVLKMNGVDRIKIFQYKYRKLRIELIHRKNLKTIYIIGKKRIIIKVLDIKESKSNVTAVKTLLNKNKVIVIDSGHGGKDSGAVGDKKRYEKNTVFAVSKYLYNDLKKRGYRVYLTRNKDRFIQVKNRTVLANRKKADIFISIHANAAPKSVRAKARGIETYFLSPARSARAKRVAALENSSDMNAMSNNSQNTFLTILNQSKITSSQKLGIDVQQHLLYSARKKYKDVVDGGVREGPFWVLVGAQMPSILIEIGYITHKEEGRRLFVKSYQKTLAKGIADGIDAYFAKNQ
ncbi:N-acetylmuramoyl-L-alanine amidase [uncultured Arcobacter sp.]|uniref:N-acetylmuramoyl-L-alanine amidase family protein n=1 Tax=uncultured Arcobacter sp. TaxID=165434 RepID=UPI00262B162C|nr:N-acetylmuramoyl-L-alanine amidase [uncultured Arcobacter sp.]